MGLDESESPLPLSVRTLSCPLSCGVALDDRTSSVSSELLVLERRVRQLPGMGGQDSRQSGSWKGPD